LYNVYTQGHCHGDSTISLNRFHEEKLSNTQELAVIIIAGQYFSWSKNKTFMVLLSEFTGKQLCVEALFCFQSTCILLWQYHIGKLVDNNWKRTTNLHFGKTLHWQQPRGKM
jgi:hypothetical protein